MTDTAKMPICRCLCGCREYTRPWHMLCGPCVPHYGELAEIAASEGRPAYAPAETTDA